MKNKTATKKKIAKRVSARRSAAQPSSLLGKEIEIFQKAAEERIATLIKEEFVHLQQHFESMLRSSTAKTEIKLSQLKGELLMDQGKLWHVDFVVSKIDLFTMSINERTQDIRDEMRQRLGVIEKKLDTSNLSNKDRTNSESRVTALESKN